MCASYTGDGDQMLGHLNTRLNISKLHPVLFERTKPLKLGDIVEVCGESGCGKTELLLHWTVQCILPDKWKESELGGLNTGVLFIDNDYHFSILRLVSILESQIRQKVTKNESENISAGDLEKLMKSCLQRLYVERCQNTVEFLLSVEMLETLLGNKPNISVVMVDSISAFYWLDKDIGEARLKHLTARLEKLVQDYQLIAFITNSLVSQHQNEGGTSAKTVMSDPVSRTWRKITTHKYFISRNSASEFTIGLQGSHSDEQTVLKFFISDAGIVYKSSQ
ncbi:DNA repair protein XRCC2-like [Ptychodera flava]|uniref:DNA repair protein XRCC2-like n=1 Tax=Ptychodera flava TaxID=63121 RepID=UPI00396A6E21